MYNQGMIGTIDVNCIKLNSQLCLTKSQLQTKRMSLQQFAFILSGL